MKPREHQPRRDWRGGGGGGGDPVDCRVGGPGVRGLVSATISGDSLNSDRRGCVVDGGAAVLLLRQVPEVDPGQ